MYRLKPWQIVALGVLAVLAGQLAVAILAHLAYVLFPEAWAWVMVSHLAGAGVAWYFIARPFVHAYTLRIFLGNVNIVRPPLDVFDQKAQ